MAPLFIGIAWTFKAAGVTIGFLIACSKPVTIGFHVAEAVRKHMQHADYGDRWQEASSTIQET